MAKHIQSQHQRVPSNTATVVTAATTNAVPVHLIAAESQNQNGINGRISNVSFASYGDGGVGGNENQLKIENTKNLVSTTTNQQNQLNGQQHQLHHQNGEQKN